MVNPNFAIVCGNLASNGREIPLKDGAATLIEPTNQQGGWKACHL